jgi:5'-nucleotidase
VNRILVTNDDGIDAPGLHALAIALDAAGYDVLVVASDRDHSGYGAAVGDLGRGSDLSIRPATIPGGPGIPAWSLVGPPALCVMAARLGGFGDPPTMVASGINPGNNTGRAVLHSGTVGAALTAANLGMSAVAVSVATDPAPRYDTAAAVGVAALGWVEAADERTVLNVNVPAVDLAAVKGTRWAELAPFGTVRAALRQRDETNLEFTLVETNVELPPESDTALVTSGYVAVTGLQGVRASEWEPVAAEVDRRLAAMAASTASTPASRSDDLGGVA